MATISADRVKETSTTTGTGSFTLAGAYAGFRAFSSVCTTNDTLYYCIVHQTANEWEVGFGTYSGSNTLARTTVISSTNSNSAVSFSAGTKDVFVTVPAEAVDALPSLSEGRLSLDSAFSCPVTDISGVSTIYYIPHCGNRISVYTGGRWKTFTFGVTSTISIAIGTMTAWLPYDIYIYDNAGTLTLEKLAWTNASTRATDISQASGVWCKSGDFTRKYLGTFTPVSTTTTSDTTALRLLFNAYNQTRRAIFRYDATASWTYSTNTWRVANNNAANRFDITSGLLNTTVDVTLSIFCSNSAFAAQFIGIGVDTFAAATYAVDMVPGAGLFATVTMPVTFNPGLGYHWYPWLEYGSTTGTQTWYGYANWLSGFMGVVCM